MDDIIRKIDNIRNNATKKSIEKQCKIINNINKFSQEADSIKDACEKAGVKYADYYNARRVIMKQIELEKKEKKIKDRELKKIQKGSGKIKSNTSSENEDISSNIFHKIMNGVGKNSKIDIVDVMCEKKSSKKEPTRIDPSLLISTSNFV